MLVSEIAAKVIKYSNANADESSHSKANMNSAIEKIFKTTNGIALLKAIYGLA